MSNLNSDILRTEFSTDFAITNCGCLRANSIFKAGVFTYRNLNNILPAVDNIVTCRLTGDQLKRVLENGVSSWPRFDGRWPTVSGFKYTLDGEAQVGSRILKLEMEDGTPI